MNNLFQKIGAVLVSLATVLGLHGGVASKQDVQNIQVPQTVQFGATTPVAGTTYVLAGNGISSSATSLTLQSFTIPQTGYKIQDGDLPDTFYLTLESGSRAKQEIVGCTTDVQNANGTATISGCSRGLLPFSPYTASSTYAFVHSGGSSVVLSDPPQLFQQYIAKANNETITGLFTFSSTSIPKLDVNPSAGVWTGLSSSTLVTLGQLNATAISGASNANETTNGISEIATATEAASSTSLGGTGARIVLPASMASSTGGQNTPVIPITQTDGTLSTSFINQTKAYTWSSATSTFSATTSIAAKAGSSLFLNSVPLQFPSAQGAASTTLMNNGSGVLSWSASTTYALSTTSTAYSLSGNGGTTVTGVAICPSTKLVSGGGFNNSGIGSTVTGSSGTLISTWAPIQSYPSDARTWTVTMGCSGPSGLACSSGTTFTVYAMCINP